MTAIVVALGLVVALLGLLVAGLLRSHAEILRQLHTLGAGLESTDSAPEADDHHRHEADFGVRGDVVAPKDGDTRTSDIVGVTPTDEGAAIAVIGAQHDTLVAFLSSGCLTCSAFWTAFADPGLELPGGTRLVVVTRGPEAESASALREMVPAGVPVVMSTSTWEAYDVPGSPYFVHVEGSGGRVLGEGTASGWPQVAQLLRTADGDSRGTDGRRRSVRDVPALPTELPRDDRDNAERIDAELIAAGITPGHTSLYGAGQQPPASDPGAETGNR